MEEILAVLTLLVMCEADDTQEQARQAVCEMSKYDLRPAFWQAREGHRYKPLVLPPVLARLQL